jgi:hypothetical protein
MSSKTREIITTVPEFIFFVAWAIYLLAYMFFVQTEFKLMYDLDFSYKFAVVISASLIVLKMILFDRYTPRNLLAIMLILGLFLYDAMLTDSSILLISLLFILASKNIKFECFVKVDFCLRLFILLSVLALCLLGVLPNYGAVINGSEKQALGFYHPNTLGIFAITIVIEWFFVKLRKMSFIAICIVVASLAIIYSVCKPRSSIVSLAVICLIYLLDRKNSITNSKFGRILLIALPTICAGISLVLTNLYSFGNIAIYNLDALLTTRIKMGSAFLQEYGLGLFGQHITTVGTRQALVSNTSTNILDMGYMHLAINNGLIVLIIAIIALSIMQYRSIKINNKPLLLCNTFFILLGFSETYLYMIAFNFALLGVFCINSNYQQVHSKKIAAEKPSKYHLYHSAWRTAIPQTQCLTHKLRLELLKSAHASHFAQDERLSQHIFRKG